MGQKRKASDSLSPSSIASPPSSFNNSAHTNLNAPPPLDSHIYSPSNHASPHPSSTDNDPNHLNSRTRKRFRDNRPDENTIHQNTLSKLYSAQRQASKTDAPDNTMPLPPSPTSSRPSLASQGSFPSASHTATSQGQKQKAQASLHAFFGGNSGGSGGDASQPAQSLLDGAPQSSSPTFAACEDCSAPLLLLLPTSSLPTLDTEMMDLDADHLLPISSAGGGEGDVYSCAQCGKRVCDTCAVRGDWRMCLECANPGSGFRRGGYGGSALGGMSCGVEAGQGGVVEKRWVGGIGWL